MMPRRGADRVATGADLFGLTPAGRFIKLHAEYEDAFPELQSCRFDSGARRATERLGASQLLASAKTVSLTPRFNAGKRMLIVTLQLFLTVFLATNESSECSQAFTGETVGNG
jgi:hypothetical protein